MTQSTRRLSGKTALTSGLRLKFVVAALFAVITAGFLIFEPGNVTAKFSGSDCGPAPYSETNKPQDCSLTNAATVAATTPTPLDPVSLSTAPEPEAVTRAEVSHQSRHDHRVRSWDNEHPQAESAYPKYTMAEICSSSADDSGLYCQTGNYNTKLNDSASAALPESATAGRISGRVLTTQGIGLNGVRVIASPEWLKDRSPVASSETLRFWTMTDGLGAYTLDGLPDGEYTLRSTPLAPYQTARISTRTGVNFADLLVFRNAEAVVEGQVLTSTGEPLEGVTVAPGLVGQPSVLTDDNGYFLLPVSVKPTIDSLTVRFQRPGFSEQSSKVNLGSIPALNGIPQTADLQVVMDPVEFWTSLEGVVYSDSGDPLAGHAVELKALSAQQKYTATTDSQGHYLFPVIESPANYHLVVFGGMDHKDYQHNIQMTADMAEQNVFLEPYEFGRLTGQLVNLNGVPVSDFDLMLRNTGSQKPNAVFSTDQHGHFEIQDAPAGDFVVASVSTPSILVQGLNLKPDEILHLPLVLDWGEHEIRGSVIDANGNPVAASRIILQWSHEMGGVTTRATRRTAADIQGHFAFSNLGPGPHSLIVDAPGFPTVDLEHDLSKRGYDLTVRLN